MLRSSAMIGVGRAISLCALAATTAGCAAPYYWQAIGGQLELLRKREPIEEVIADPAADPQLKTTLARIATMRRFAVDELLLPSNDSYTTYVALDRPYVVWNVVATDGVLRRPAALVLPVRRLRRVSRLFRQGRRRSICGRARRRRARRAQRRLDGVLDARVLRRPRVEHDGRTAASSTSRACCFTSSRTSSSTSRTTASSAKRSRWSSRSSARSAGCRSTVTPADLERYRTAAASGASSSASSSRRSRLGLRAIYASGAPPEQLRDDKAAGLRHVAGASTRR